MESKLMKYLKVYKKKRIQLIELYSYFSANESYERVSECLINLIENEYLKPVKASGSNGKNPPLYNTYAINKTKMNVSYYNELQRCRMRLHSAIKLDVYYERSEKQFLEDLPYLELLSSYLEEHGLPDKEEVVQGRSYEIAGDEKWLQEKKGIDLLKRVDLLKKMKLTTIEDPAMFALNASFMKYDTYKHLIVENKTVYLHLLELLQDTGFSTLIYGAGWRIVSSTSAFEKQFPFKDKPHTFYYFGDMDYEGIKIFHNLSNKQSLVLAKPFYEAFLKGKVSDGKTNQKKDSESLNFFLSHFNENTAQKFKAILKEGTYYPQEALNDTALADAWRICHEL